MSWSHFGWAYGLALVSLAFTLASTFATVHLLTRGERVG
jgi:hypothetical protein